MAHPNFKTLTQPDLLAYIHAKLIKLDRLESTKDYSMSLQHKLADELKIAFNELTSRPDYQWTVFVPWLEDPERGVRVVAGNTIIDHDPEQAIPVLEALVADGKGGSPSIEARQKLRGHAKRQKQAASQQRAAI